MLGFTFNPQKRFAELGEREILALAITLEEEDGRIYREFAEGLRDDYPASAEVFDGMAEEESEHRRMLIELFRERFGDHIPLVRRQDVRGFVQRQPVWLIQPLGPRDRPPPGREHGAGNRQLLPRGRRARSDAGIRKLLGRSGRGRGGARTPRRAELGGDAADRDRARERGAARAPRASCCRSCSPASPA